MYKSEFKDIAGLLIDATGVLYNSDPYGGTPVPSSVEALNRLKERGIPFKICSNQSTLTRTKFTKKLQRYGYNLTDEDIICPGPLISTSLKQLGLRPHLLVHPNSIEEYDGIERTNPNCIVLGDCQEHFNYHNLNEAFNILQSCDVKRLYTFGAGKYYRRGEDLVLDSGAYARMLQHATDCELIICGKPEPSYFAYAVSTLNLEPSQCAMIGDDLVNDVAGAHAFGMKGFQVKTGKYRIEDENHASIKADYVFDNLLHAVDDMIKYLDKHDSGIDLCIMNETP